MGSRPTKRGVPSRRGAPGPAPARRPAPKRRRKGPGGIGAAGVVCLLVVAALFALAVRQMSAPPEPASEKSSAGAGTDSAPLLSFERVLDDMLAAHRIPPVDVKRDVAVRSPARRTRYWRIFLQPDFDPQALVAGLGREARRRGGSLAVSDAPERGGYAMQSVDARVPEGRYLILLAAKLNAPEEAPEDAPEDVDAREQRPEPPAISAALPAMPGEQVRATPPGPAARAGAVRAAAPSPPAVAAPAPRPGAAPRIAILIDDVGGRLDILEQAARIPYALTFAIIPRLAHSRAAAELLVARGFEVMLHLPMQPATYPRENPGEGAILAAMTADEIRATTAADIDAIPGLRGVNNHMGSLITSDPRLITPVLEVVKSRGLYFVDSRTVRTTVAHDVAKRMRIPSASRSVFLDDFADEAYIRSQLDVLVARARQDGEAIGIGHIYPETIRTLSKALPALHAQGIEIVPASSLVR